MNALGMLLSQQIRYRQHTGDEQQDDREIYAQRPHLRLVFRSLGPCDRKEKGAVFDGHDVVR